MGPWNIFILPQTKLLPEHHYMRENTFKGFHNKTIVQNGFLLIDDENLTLMPWSMSHG